MTVVLAAARAHFAVLPALVEPVHGDPIKVLIDDPILSNAGTLIKRVLVFVIALDALRRYDLKRKVGGPSK